MSLLAAISEEESKGVPLWHTLIETNYQRNVVVSL